MSALRAVLIVLTIPFAARSAGAETLVVPDDFNTIQEAIDAAEVGDVILVEPEFYFENLDFLGKEITLQSCEGPESTIIDGSTLTRGEDYGSVVSFTNGETPNTRLEGFTLTGGIGTAVTLPGGEVHRLGGGVYCTDSAPTLTGNIIQINAGCGVRALGSSLTLVGCTIRDNTGPSGAGICVGGESETEVVLLDCHIIGNRAEIAGGGLHTSGGLLHLERCLFEENDGGLGAGGVNQSSLGVLEVLRCEFRGNSASFGAGGLLISGEARILSCRIEGNSAGVGGGLYIGGTQSVLVERCVIDGNVASTRSGGVAVSGALAEVLLRHCSFFDNTGEVAGAIGSDLVGPTADAVLENCILWQNGDAPIQEKDFTVTITYSDVEGGWDGEGNIDEDPLFVDAENGDFRLTEDSPCIDAGDPDSLFDLDNTIADIGAYFHMQFGFLRGDVDGDGAVAALFDALDLLEWQFADGDEPPCHDAADVDDSGTVSALVDAFALLIWGFQDGPAPEAPGPDTCGVDWTDDETGCESMLECEEG